MRLSRGSRSRGAPFAVRPGRVAPAARFGCVLVSVVLLVSVDARAGAPVRPPPGTDQPPEAVSDHGWPVAGDAYLTRRFDPPPRRWLSGHRGADLAATPGALVLAAGAGVVHFAGPVAGRGVVSIDHPGGLRTTYQPVTPLVSAGEPVLAGAPIGILRPGHAGCPVEACLHWGLRQGEFYLDPLALLGLGAVRLLPRRG